MDSWRYLEKFLVVENCGQVRKKFLLVYRKNRSARLVHSSRTAAKHVHAHRYPRGISLIFIYFFKLSTAWSGLYYYDYFFIKLPKNNRGQVRSSLVFPDQHEGALLCLSTWTAEKIRLQRNTRAAAGKSGVRCAARSSRAGDKCSWKSV